ncbi:mechanosensitive ion channel family protein [Candidatus Woesearchaeota archaeon]|nr:mechanosensitive ion channel family protein [Candidatus Woesearchaeota archaeon]
MDFAEIINNILANRYLGGLFIFVVFYVLAELVKFVLEGVFLKLAKRTKTKLDDFLIKKTKRPISLLLMMIGLKLGFNYMQLAGKTGDVIDKIVNSFITIIVIYISVAIIKLIVDYWGESIAKKTKSAVDEHLIIVLKKSMSVVFFIAILLAILHVWGIEIGPLLAGLGIGGIAIAFALQKSLGNIFGGISLILDRSVAVGDVVVMDADTKGEIVDIGLRSTKIKTFDNEFVIVPNGKLEEMNIHNIAKPEPSVRIVVPFNVAYRSNVAKVKKIVLKELSKVDGLDKKEDRKPFVRFLEMGESGMMFKAYFYIRTYKDKYNTIDQATTLIYNALNKNRIRIPFPQMDVHLKKR